MTPIVTNRLSLIPYVKSQTLSAWTGLVVCLFHVCRALDLGAHDVFRFKILTLLKSRNPLFVVALLGPRLVRARILAC